MSDQQFTFQEHDKLNRKPFADFLFSLIQHRDEYRRPDSNKSYSIAIDAVYGSGKTRFLKMFQSMLREEGQCNVAYYSAWEHDLYDDALAPILSLLDRPAGVFEDQAYERMEATLGSKALRVLKRMGTSFLSLKAKTHFGKDYEEIINDIKDLLNGEASESDAYDLRMKCIAELQKGLAKTTEEAPLIFIIDELDRCNPAFAIKTLEVAKHLLDVKNVVFIFALDMRQMRAAVRKFYGQDIDADGYLCKVFDYMTLLPAPSCFEYGLQAMKTVSASLNKDYPEFISFAVNLFHDNNCTLRFIDTFISAFQVMWNAFLREYESTAAYILYFFALFLKYRYPDVFLETTQRLNRSAESQERLIKIGAQNKYLREYFCHCCDLIGDSEFNYITYAGKKERFMSLDVHDNQSITLRKSSIAAVHIHVSSEDSICGMLFYRDFASFDKIKELTYGQYIHRQLEMYNPIRTEEAIDTPSA